MAASALLRNIAPESFFWVIESLSRDAGLPCSREQLLRSHPPPYDCCALQAAVQALGIESALVEIDAHAIDTGEEAWFALVASAGSDPAV